MALFRVATSAGSPIIVDAADAQAARNAAQFWASQRGLTTGNVAAFSGDASQFVNVNANGIQTQGTGPTGVEASLGAQFAQALQSPAQGINPYGSLAQRQFNPNQGAYQSLFNVGTALGQPGTNITGENAFTRWLNSVGFGSDIYGQGQTQLGALAGAGGDLVNQFTDPNPQNIGDVSNLGQLALGGATNRSFASLFGADIINRIQQRYQDLQETAPGTTGNYAAYLQSGLGL